MAFIDRSEEITPYALASEAKKRLLELASRSDLLVFGEVHGTQEVPRLILGLLNDLAALGYQGLALEIPYSEQQQLIALARGETSQPPNLFGPADVRDGRGNVQLLSLLRQALAPDIGWQLLCFDLGKGQSYTDWAERDAGMAQNLIRQWQELGLKTKLLAICGNLHSRLSVSPGVYEDIWPSFAYSVSQLLPQARVHSVNIVFQSGFFFNGEVKPFYSSEPLRGEAEVRSEDQMGHTLALHLPLGTPVTFLPSGDEEP